MIIETDRWTLYTPDTPPQRAPLVTMATIHPKGDQRVLKSIQSLLDAGCRVHIIWLGPPATKNFFDEWLSETVVHSATSTRDRLLRTVEVTRQALEAGGDIFYCHDLYMLPHAAFWAKRARSRRIVFDSHEFYPDLYSSKFPPKFRRPARKLLTLAMRILLRPIDAFVLVDSKMTVDMDVRERPVIIAPNFPSQRIYAKLAKSADADRMRRVIHTGTLASSYGSELLVEFAHLVDRKLPGVEVTVIERYLSSADELEFRDLLSVRGTPNSLRLVPPRPASDVQELLLTHGVGLSLIQAGGQNDLAVPTKLYEYAANGLYVLGTDLQAQKNFIETSPGVVGSHFGTKDAQAMVARLIETLESLEDVLTQLGRATSIAQREFVWDKSCGPQFSVIKSLIPIN